MSDDKRDEETPEEEGAPEIADTDETEGDAKVEADAEADASHCGPSMVILCVLTQWRSLRFWFEV